MVEGDGMDGASDGVSSRTVFLSYAYGNSQHPLPRAGSRSDLRKVDCLPLLEHQPDVDSTMPTTRTVAVPSGRKVSIMTSGGCVRVVMTISVGVSARTVSFFASVLVSLGCSIIVPMLVWALLSMFVSMFVLAVLRLKAERSHAAHCEYAKA